MPVSFHLFGTTMRMSTRRLSFFGDLFIINGPVIKVWEKDTFLIKVYEWETFSVKMVNKRVRG